AALVGLDVRLAVGEDRPVGWRERREAEGVGGRAGGDCEHPHLGGEELAEAALEALRPLVIAVAVHPAVVDGLQRREDLGAGGRGVVAQELHAALLLGQSMRQRNDQAPKARNASAVAPRYRRFGAMARRPAPSSITARAASSA